VFESLVKAGAFDSLAPDETMSSRDLRPRLMAAVDAACEHGARMQDDRARGQAQLFGDFGHEDSTTHVGDGLKAVPPHGNLPNATPWTETEQLAFEKETLGLYWSGHPVDRYAGALREFGAKTIVDLADAQPAPGAETWGPGGRKPIEIDTSVGGIVAAVRQLKTRKGDRMAVFTLEDAVGNVEVVVFPEAYQRANGLIDTGTLVLVRGKLERDDETVRIIASEIAPLDSVRERIAREVAIHLKRPADRDTLETLCEIFSKHRGDRRISFEVETGEGPNRIRVRVDVSSQIRVTPSSKLIDDIEKVIGAGAVELR